MLGCQLKMSCLTLVTGVKSFVNIYVLIDFSLTVKAAALIFISGFLKVSTTQCYQHFFFSYYLEREIIMFLITIHGKNGTILLFV